MGAQILNSRTTAVPAVSTGRMPVIRHPQRYLIVVIIAAAALYLIGNDRVGLWDRDEPRYAQTSKQMLLSNPPDWVVPRLLDDVRTAKPIFIYWCQAGAMWLLHSTDPFAARLPSAVAMLITLIVLGIAIGKSIGWWRAFWTVFTFATCGLVIAAAKMCITDSVLLLWITVAQLCLFAVYQGSRSWLVTIIMWLAIGLAMLTKGPVVVGIQLTTMVTLAALDVGKTWPSGRAWLEAIRWWWRTRPLIGLLLAAAVVTPWLIAVQHREPTFLRRAFLHDVLTRTMKPLEGHAGPPGYYLVTILGTFFPWCILLPAALPWAWRNRRLAPLRFALAGVIGPWILMEIVRTKLAHYILPAFPPLAFITADMLFRAIRGQIADLRRTAFIALVAIWAIIVAALGSAPWLATRKFDSLPTVPMLILTLAGITYAAAVFILFARRRIALAATAMGTGMIAVIVTLCALYLPCAGFLWLPERVASVLLEQGATRSGDVINLDYREDSLAYYQGGTIREKENSYFADTPRDQWATWIVLTSDLWKKLPADVRLHYESFESFRGLAYAKRGSIVEVMIIRRIDPHR